MQALIRPVRQVLSANASRKAVRSLPFRPVYPADMVWQQPADAQGPRMGDVDFATALKNLQRAIQTQPPSQPVSVWECQILYECLAGPNTMKAEALVPASQTAGFCSQSCRLPRRCSLHTFRAMPRVILGPNNA